jgi:hypothetical protein
MDDLPGGGITPPFKDIPVNDVYIEQIPIAVI